MMKENGIVYLIGAGPGDPGLFTLRGMECLKIADVVIYDNLANPTLLQHAKEGAEKIYVGKQAGNHALPQKDINMLLAKKAKEGLSIARLKGGDPLVFGRGGEEALTLLDEEVPFEIIPGVTAGVAATAYAGIPATHRTCNSVLTFITGHEDPTKEESYIDWKSLAIGGGTLIFYMGIKNLPNIAKRLIEGGRAPETPAAVIRCGTLPEQQVVTATLKDIYEKATESEIKPPALIVVGDVVNLRPQLKWFESRPLFGKTIAVTRTRTQASALAEKLTSAGANVLPFPTIAISPPEDSSPLDDAVLRCEQYDWIIFTSTNAVESFFASLARQGLDSRALKTARACSIGPGTTRELAKHGITADLEPKSFTSKGVYEALKSKGEITGKRFFLPRANIANPELNKNLESDGGIITEVTAYKTVPGNPDNEVFEALKGGLIDMVTFTSSSTANNYANMVRERLGEIPAGVIYASIGPETSNAAKAQGMDISIEAKQHDIEGLVKAITN